MEENISVLTKKQDNHELQRHLQYFQKTKKLKANML